MSLLLYYNLFSVLVFYTQDIVVISHFQTVSFLSGGTTPGFPVKIVMMRFKSIPLDTTKDFCRIFIFINRESN